MSLPKIQYQLTGRPRLLAGSTWFLLNGRPISYALAGAIDARALSSQADPVAKPRISFDFENPMSSSRDAFLGHEPVSPLLCAPAHEHRGFRECAKIETSGVG